MKPKLIPAWKALVCLIRYQPRLYLIMVIAMLFWSLLVLGQAVVIQRFFDLLGGKASPTLGLWGLVGVALAVRMARSIANLINLRVRVLFTIRATTLMRKNLLAHILSRPGARALPGSPAEALSRFKGDVEEVALFTTFITEFFSNIVFSIIAILSMLSISIPITVAALIPFVVVTLIANLSGKRVQRYRMASREATGRVVGFLGETFGSVQAVKLAAGENTVIAQLNRLNAVRQQATIKDVLFNQLLQSSTANAVSLSTGLILLLGGQLIREGRFTVGDFALFVYYLENLGYFLALFGQVVVRYRQVSVSIERVYRLTEGAPPDTFIRHNPIYLNGQSPHSSSVPAELGIKIGLNTLIATNITYCYPGTSNGIGGINLRLERGTITVITGRVSSGKTTLLLCLLGLLPMDEGEIRWNGEVISQPDDFMTPPRAAYTPQVPGLFSDTVRYNILLGMRKGHDEVLDAIHDAVMETDLAMLKAGLDTVIGTKGVKLSGGQAQRTAAARMFIREPELLVFDDLSSALDVETEQRLWENIISQPGRTCLAVSHRRPALQRADQILVLKDGKLLDEGKLDELLERNDELRRIWQGED